MGRALRVLNIEDSERDVELLRSHLSRAGYDLVLARVETASSMKSALETEQWDVILSNYSMPHFSALQALEVLNETGLDIPFIIISDTIGEEVAVAAMRAGANDYLMRDNLAQLGPTIERETHEAENRRASRRAEESVNASGAELRALFAAMTDVTLVLDAEGRYLKIAPTDPAYLYKPPDDLIGKTLNEVFPKEESDFFLDHIRRALTEGRTHRVEYRLQIGEKEIWFDGSVSPISQDSVIWITRDITERRQADEALSRSEERYRFLFERNLAGVYRATLEDEILDCNEAAARILGYDSPEEVLQHHIMEFYADSADRDAAVGQLQKTGSLTNYEIAFKKRDGSRIWVLQNINFIEGDEKRPTLFEGTLIDITERKRAEQELSKSEERYRDLVENAHDIIYSHDLEGNFTSVNKAGEQITGYPREETLRMNLAQITAPEFVEKARQMIARKLAGQEVTAYELEIIAKDGRRVAVEVNSKVVYQDGVPVGVQGIARDVTERKQLEEQLRQSQKMEAIGRLAGGIAHDFNNLLTAITGYSELTMRRLQGQDPLLPNLEEIKKAGDRAASLTRQLLAFSRKQVMQPKVVDLNSVVSDLERMLRRLIGEDIELRTVLEPKLGSIRVDPGQIEQIIMNLAVNARDAMPQGGKLTIETKNVYLDDEYARKHIAVIPGPFVMLAMSDTGTGMDPQTEARIFEPFFTTKEVGKGTGLGLSTVYGIVKQSGGNIWVYSETGLGATFKIYLPRIDEDVQEYKRTTGPEEVLQGTETILVAEDEEIVRKLARQVLGMYGYEVLEAADGEEALSICARHAAPIHLLITDVIMPKMSGRELANLVAEVRPEIKVLYMSGYADNAVVHQGVLDQGANFIQKPFSTDALATRVREVLDAPGQGPSD